MYYASDIHGSDVLWRKFINAGRFYKADILVMGGDIAGKAVVPIVSLNGGFRVGEDPGLVDADAAMAAEKRIRDRGFYPWRASQDDVASVHGDEQATEALFRDVMVESLERWLAFADERLAGTGIPLYVMLGNDDDPFLQEVLSAAKTAVDPEDIVVDLPDGFQMISCGYANPTPWHTIRELPEDQLGVRIESSIQKLADPSRSIFNLHVPPINTPLDRAPELDDSLKPVVRGGAIQIAPAGSRAVRELIERYQPALALHGHIHESRGITRIGRTVCINPGSEYGEGILHGALVVLDRKKGVRTYQLVSG